VRIPLTPAMIVLLQTIAALTVAPFFNSLFALGEELGWRGFLLPRLMRSGIGQWTALVTSGAVWGVWHAPIILLGHNYPDHPRLGVLLMTVFCVLLGVLFGWLRLASRSVWPSTIAHATLNAVAGLPLVLLTPFNFALGGMLTGAVGWIPLALLIAWLTWSGRLPVRPRDDEGLDETA
jgi:membrane protease YdiL (CAAX protease family)